MAVVVVAAAAAAVVVVVVVVMAREGGGAGVRASFYQRVPTIAAPRAPLAQSDVRVNFGERLLASLFDRWRAAQLQPPPSPPKEAPLPMLRFRPLEEVRILISQGGAVLHQSSAAALEQLSAPVVPGWVSQCVLHGSFAHRESSKLSFFLSPHASDSLPPLPPGVSKLSASKFLKMHKVRRQGGCEAREARGGAG